MLSGEWIERVNKWEDRGGQRQHRVKGMMSDLQSDVWKCVWKCAEAKAAQSWALTTTACRYWEVAVLHDHSFIIPTSNEFATSEIVPCFSFYAVLSSALSLKTPSCNPCQVLPPPIYPFLLPSLQFMGTAKKFKFLPF